MYEIPIRRPLLFAPNAKSYLLNYNPLYVTKIHAAVAAAKAGSRRPIFVTAGDSTTYGIGAGGSNIWLGAAQSSAVAVVSSLLSAAGVPAQNNSVWGNGSGGETLTQFLQHDSRLSGFTGWSITAAVGAGLPGGEFLVKSTADANAGTFAPGGVTTDTALITYASNPTSGTFTVDVGGSVLATVATAAVLGLHQRVVSLPRGVNVLNIKCTVAGSGIFLMGVEMYDSVSPPQISLLNWGAPGAKSADVADTSQTYTTGTCLASPIFAQDATFINVGINDWHQAVSPAVFAGNLQTIITKSKAQGGDVVLCTPFPSDPSIASLAAQAAIVAQILPLAVSNNCVVVDFNGRFGTNAAAQAAGYGNADGIHPLATGYAVEAPILAKLMLAA